MNIWDYEEDLMRRGLVQPGMDMGSRAVDYGVPMSAQPQPPASVDNSLLGGGQPTQYMPDGLSGAGQFSDVADPEAPKPEDLWRQWIGDPSGFAGAGMNTPATPDPMQQIGNLMAMSMKQAGRPQAGPLPGLGGNLMNYLQMLSGGQGG